MSICILLDENVPLIIQVRLEPLVPSIQVYAIGDGDAPPKGTPDAAILEWMEARNCLLITNNRSTMPVHLADHLSRGVTFQA